MNTSAVFIVPNNQSQEFLVTKTENDGYPKAIYVDLENYLTEPKARKLARLPEFDNLESEVENINVTEGGSRAWTLKFSYGYGGLRSLLRRKEFEGKDYYYYFTKGRWLWSDDPEPIVQFLKDGSLLMGDDFLSDVQADILEYLGNVNLLYDDDPQMEIYKTILNERKFAEYFKNLLDKYKDYFEDSNLCFFYESWIRDNSKGVAAILRTNILKELKRRGMLVKMKEEIDLTLDSRLKETIN